jgi:hypothetical protein
MLDLMNPIGAAGRDCRPTWQNRLDGLGDQRKAVAEVVAVAREQANSPRLSPGPNAETVMLDLMNRSSSGVLGGKVAILKDRALAHGKGGATAGVAFAKADLDDAFRILATRLRADTLKPADFLSQRPAMRTRRSFRPASLSGGV